MLQTGRISGKCGTGGFGNIQTKELKERNMITKTLLTLLLFAAVLILFRKNDDDLAW